ncbi:hypothetical protein KAR91_53765 [Candidatus Pacearchaeota archaeon]|nr:hypothetical protein [Candidatus Pacearchaeota archaeon]
MKNKTVTINPPVEVPEGDWCYNRNQNINRCAFYRILHGKVSCRIWLKAPPRHVYPVGGEGVYKIEKCQPCKDLCEEAKEPCTTCGGSEEVKAFEQGGMGAIWRGKMKRCPDCKPITKGEKR